MQLHIIGGFLGSGKTTAIIAAAQHLSARGMRVGVITNDQGKHLVDTAILRAQDLPAMEVSGGCFCCHFDDLNDRLKDLVSQHNPDVIFAESVGSCADVVATVVRPLLEMEMGTIKPNSYTVFADVRLLRRFLNGLEMPFSEGINYIFGKQIEEAGLLFINKIDLLTPDEIREVTALAVDAYPEKTIIASSALNSADASRWVDDLQAGRYPPSTTSLQIDYDMYAAGEGRMAWIDREYTLSGPERNMPGLIKNILEKWRLIISRNNWSSGHVKVILSAAGLTKKVSLAQSGEILTSADLGEVKIPAASSIDLLLNMLVEGSLDRIAREMDAGIRAIIDQSGSILVENRSFNRRPGFPKPTYRMD